jgi:hypothetical protein
VRAKDAKLIAFVSLTLPQHAFNLRRRSPAQQPIFP